MADKVWQKACLCGERRWGLRLQFSIQGDVYNLIFQRAYRESRIANYNPRPMATRKPPTLSRALLDAVTRLSRFGRCGVLQEADHRLAGPTTHRSAVHSSWYGRQAQRNALFALTVVVNCLPSRSLRMLLLHTIVPLSVPCDAESCSQLDAAHGPNVDLGKLWWQECPAVKPRGRCKTHR